MKEFLANVYFFFRQLSAEKEAEAGSIVLSVSDKVLE